MCSRSLEIPATCDALQGVLSVIPLQLLSMHIAELRKCDVRSRGKRRYRYSNSSSSSSSRLKYLQCFLSTLTRNSLFQCRYHVSLFSSRIPPSSPSPPPPSYSLSSPLPSSPLTGVLRPYPPPPGPADLNLREGRRRDQSVGLQAFRGAAHRRLPAGCVDGDSHAIAVLSHRCTARLRRM